jgi:hypothetical protein
MVLYHPKFYQSIYVKIQVSYWRVLSSDPYIKTQLLLILILDQIIEIVYVIFIRILNK